MLTGKWGSGKSYYIKNTLKPFLESKEGGKHKCAVVSLYGLSDVSEISKAIYMELRTIKKESDSEAGNTAKVVGKIVGKTIVNGLISKIGFEIGDIKDEDIQKIYDSIDLSGKLIVLEDIERTQIDIVELLGYINNMCENDGVKVLLVANEDELLTTYEKTNNEGKIIKYYTDTAISYKRAKEKTVGDTIYFICDYLNTIQQILKKFGIFLSKSNTYDVAEDIQDIFVLMNSYNLRAFIYGCQKSKDIFEYIEHEKIHVSNDIQKIIFYGIIAFTQRQCQGGGLRFKRETNFSAELGLNDQYPLFRFCYDFIVYQELSKDDIVKSTNYYLEYCRNSTWNSGRDRDLKTIKNYGTVTEKEILDAVSNLPRKIKNGNIPYCDYGSLISYLVAIKFDAEIDINIEPIEITIIDSLKSSNDSVEFQTLFDYSCALFADEAIEHFKSFKEKIKNVLEDKSAITFTYEPSKLIDYYNQNMQKILGSLPTEGFAHKLDIVCFIEMLKQCSSEQISIIRNMFLTLYRNHSYDYILEDDIFALNELIDKLPILLDYEKYDGIQKMQIKWLLKNIIDMATRYNAHETENK